MKNLTYLSVALFLTMIIAEGCQKGKIGEVIYPGELIASKTTVKMYQPDTLTLVGAENDSVKFRVTPANSANQNYGIYKIANNKARVVFTEAGTYTVSASANGGGPVTKVITVLNETYHLPGSDNPTPPTTPPTDSAFTHIPVTGDIVITPTYHKMPTGDSTYFSLSVQTSNTYACGNSSLDIRQSQISNNYVLNIVDIIKPNAAQCVLPNTQLKAFTYFYPQVASPVTLGTTYPLTITVGGTTYTGVITFNSTYMDIVWNYTSGVTMSSKHITL